MSAIIIGITATVFFHVLNVRSVSETRSRRRASNLVVSLVKKNTIHCNFSDINFDQEASHQRERLNRDFIKLFVVIGQRLLKLYTDNRSLESLCLIASISVVIHESVYWNIINQ